MPDQENNGNKQMRQDEAEAKTERRSERPEAAHKQAELNAQTQAGPWQPQDQVQGGKPHGSQQFELKVLTDTKPNLMLPTKMSSNPATGKNQSPQASCEMPENENFSINDNDLSIVKSTAPNTVEAKEASTPNQYKPTLEIELVKHMGVIVSQLKEKNRQDNQDAEKTEDKRENIGNENDNVKKELEADNETTKHMDRQRREKLKTPDLDSIKPETKEEKDAEIAKTNTNKEIPDEPEEDQVPEDQDEDLKLGLLHTILLQCVPRRAAIIVFLLITATQQLIEASSDISLSILMHTQLFKTESYIILVTDLITIPLLLLHYVVGVMNSKIPWKMIWLEVIILVILHPLAPGLAYFSWAMAKLHKVDTTRYKNTARVMNLLRGLLLSPIQLIIITNLYLTDCLPTPWSEETKICDSNSNCVPLGPFGKLLPLASFGLSAFSMITTCADAYQPDDLIDLMNNIGFMLPVCLFKCATILIAYTLIKEYTVVVIIVTTVVNAIIIQKCTTKKVNRNGTKKQMLSNRAVNVALSAITSIVLIGTTPEYDNLKTPDDNLKTPEDDNLITPDDNLKTSEDDNLMTPEEKNTRKKENKNIAILTSLASLFFLSATNVGVYIILNTQIMVTNPNMILTNLQVNHIIQYAIGPLVLMSIATTTIFWLPTTVCCNWWRYVKMALNVMTSAATLAGVVAALYYIPEGPQQVAIMVRVRDRVDLLSGRTWEDTWVTRKEEQWTLHNFTFSDSGNFSIKERVMNNTQNIDKSLRELAVRVNVGSFMDENATINIIKLTAGEKFDMPITSCIVCQDKSSSCNRLLQDVLQRNPHLKVCGQAVAGHWSTWEHKQCMMITEVQPGQSCGRGHQLKLRQCKGRKYGGQHCSGPPANQSQCQGPPCPGMSVFLHPPPNPPSPQFLPHYIYVSRLT
jgi:hypothetical protein